jgi:hypothetical protein
MLKIGVCGILLKYSLNIRDYTEPCTKHYEMQRKLYKSLIDEKMEESRAHQL